MCLDELFYHFIWFALCGMMLHVTLHHMEHGTLLPSPFTFTLTPDMLLVWGLHLTGHAICWARETQATVTSNIM